MGLLKRFVFFSIAYSLITWTILYTPIPTIQAAFNTNCTDTSTTGIPQTECEALKDFYDSTNGDSWTDNSNWGTNTNVDTWHGITVDGGHVTIVDLFDNNVSGTLPSSISNLSYLQKISLGNNNIRGTIPTSIYTLTNLTELHLNDNQLEGEISSDIGNLTNLIKLNLAGNNLHGNIPPEIGNLTNLDYLNLARNNFSGTIPQELNNLTNLTTALSIDNNRFTFTDLEPFLTNTSLNVAYSPQQKVGTTQNKTVTPGEDLTLTVEVPENPSGHDSYQWYKDGQAIPGATNRTYTINTATENDNGTYTYQISNSQITDLTLTSNDITVTVTSTPSVIVTPPPTGIIDKSFLIIIFLNVLIISYSIYIKKFQT